MTEKGKEPEFTTFKVDTQAANRLRRLSALSGLSVAQLIREFSRLEESLPLECEKANVFFLLKKEQKYLSVMLLPQAMGSFLVSNDTPNSEIDKRIRKESFKKLGIPESD